MRYELTLKFTGREVEPGRCVRCGCTDERACEGGCHWADETHRLCSACVNALFEDAPSMGFRVGYVHDLGGELMVFAATVPRKTKKKGGRK